MGTMSNTRNPRRRTRPPADFDMEEGVDESDYTDFEPYQSNRAARRRNGRRRERTPEPSGIVITDKKIRQIPVDLLGEKYTITPPKAGPLLAIARRAANGELEDGEDSDLIDNWVLDAFGEEVGSTLLERIENPNADEEPLDVTHIQELMGAVSRYMTRQPPM